MFAQLFPENTILLLEVLNGPLLVLASIGEGSASPGGDSAHLRYGGTLCLMAHERRRNSRHPAKGVCG